MAVAAESRPVPPDTRGGTKPLPVSILAIGATAIALVLGGLIAVQAFYALFGGPLTPDCRATLVRQQVEETAQGTIVKDVPITGALGVCHIVEGLRSSGQTVLLGVGAALGLAASIAGGLSYRKMESKRMREQAIAGAVLGVQAVALAAFLAWFRSGEILIFVRNFFNFEWISGYWVRFVVVGMKNTIVLAFGGEVGGIVIGLMLAIFAISNRRTVRAPARAYINFFRGTPLIWQLAFFYFLFRLGLRLDVQGFSVALLVFSLNTGAYAAEVFRAGIQSIERGQIEAARSLGMTYLQSMRYAIVPQAVRRVIPPLMNEFVILIKDTALIAILGLTLDELDIFSLAGEGQAATYNATFYVVAALCYLIITLPLIRVVNMVERRLHSGLTGVIGS